MLKNINTTIWRSLFEKAFEKIGNNKKWHWFQYHFSLTPLHPLALSLIDACTDCEQKIPGLGLLLIHDIANIRGKEKHEPHYEQLLQKLSEVLVLRQLLMLDWPEETKFEHEPSTSPNGMRPELRVRTPDRNFLFEVKAPSLLDHIRARHSNAIQAPGRVVEKSLLINAAEGRAITLPRDNPVKEFLLDADKKFSQFKAIQPETSILVIVWDDFLYEPITALTHEGCGLLTPNSYLKKSDGTAVQFTHIDAVVLVRHLNYLIQATKDEPLVDRRHALDFGNNQSMPNVIIPTGGLNQIPSIIQSGLRAFPLNSPALMSTADYRPQEMVFWI